VFDMERIGVRELRQHATRYLARVKAGETVEVTERGRLVALLVPPAPGATDRERLIAGGRLVPAARPFRLPRRARAAEGAPATGAVLDDLRSERT
jgi:prevent-host-death family protein